jgi:hypothetical protein
MESAFSVNPSFSAELRDCIYRKIKIFCPNFDRDNGNMLEISPQ